MDQYPGVLCLMMTVLLPVMTSANLTQAATSLLYLSLASSRSVAFNWGSTSDFPTELY